MSPEKTNLHEELQERLRFEGLIADISSRFVGLPPGEVEREIADAQRRICELLGLGFSALWQRSDEPPGFFTLTHFYSDPEVPQPPARMNQDQYPWAREQLLAGRVIKVSSLRDLPPEATLDRETLRRFGILSNLALPLCVGGEPPIGILGLGTTRVERDWPDALVSRLQLLAQVLTNALVRKRADQALRESELRLALAADSAEAGLWVLDCGTQVFWATQKARVIFGYLPDEVVSMDRFRASVHPDDWHRVQEALERAVHAGEPVNVEYRVRQSDAQERWIASRGRPFFKPTGEPERVLGVSIDITDRKRSEAALLISQARLAAGIDLAALGYYEVDFGEPACFTDDRFRQICGVPAGQLPGLQALTFWMECLHPDDRQRVLDERQRLHEGRIERLSTEYRYLHPDQGEKWIHHAARVAARNASGHTIRSFGVVRDITEMKRLAERLQSAAHEWQVTFDSISDMVMILDAEHRVVRVNAATGTFLGLPAERLVGSLCCALLHGTSCTADRCPCQITFRTKARSELELYHAASGKWLLLTTDPILDGAGNVRGAVHVGRDLTERKRAEAESLQQRAELAHLSRVAMLGELSGSLAHELNQPLTAILSNAQAAQRFLANDPPDLDEVRDILKDIVAEDKRAGEVIRRLRLLLKKGQVQHYRGTQGTSIIGLFGGAAAWTGVSEKTLQRLGDEDYEKIYLFPNSHAGYYPGAKMLGLKFIFRKSNGKVLGAQALGEDGPAVDKRISAIAVAIQMGATIYDLEEAELCYAPQFGSAKDAVNFAGMVAADVLRGDMPVSHWESVDGAFLLDVREPVELAVEQVPGAVNIPMGQLRSRLAELPRDREIHVICRSAQRAYYATRILLQTGFKAQNISGGMLSRAMRAIAESK